MTQHFYYFSPQTPGANRWTVDLGTSAIRLGDIPGWATAAENGDVAQNGVAIDDPTGNAGYFGDGILGLKTFYVTEDYCAPYGADGVNGTRLWTGYIRERRYRRGNQSPSTSLLTGAARRIDIGLEDLNSLAAFRVIGDPSGVRDAAHGNRPAETDVERILWLISTVYLPVTNDAGWIDTTGGVNMDANDYTGASAADVIHDCATASGKDWWIGYWEATGTDCLWYRKSSTATIYASLLSLTDDIADLTLLSTGEVDPTSTVWPVMPDAELLRDPTFTYAGLYEPYDNGYIIAQQATTANTYAWRDGTAPNANVKTATKANAIATRLLAQDSTEQDRVTARVQLPASLATGIKAGQRIRFRSLFMPGYDSWVWMRVVRCTVAQDEETDQRYTFSLEMLPGAPAAVCATSLGAVVTVDTGHTSSASITPASGIPAVLFGIANIRGASGITDGATFTRLTLNGISQTSLYVEYKAVASPSGAYTVDASGTGTFSWGALSVRTASTAPVQTITGAWTDSILADLTLGATPTQGNMLFWVVATNKFLVAGPQEWDRAPHPFGSSGYVSQDHWTLIYSHLGSAGTGEALLVFAHCVEAVDYQHWQDNASAGDRAVALFEWQIT